MEPINIHASDHSDWGAQRQINYDHRIARELLVAVHDGNTFAATHAKRNAGEDFGCAWFNRTFTACPVAVVSRRLDKPLALASFWSPPDRCEYFKHYKEALQDHAGGFSFTALVFDHHDDGVSDLVVHNAPFVSDDATSHEHRFRVSGNSQIFFIHPWKHFLARLADRFKPA